MNELLLNKLKFVIFELSDILSPESFTVDRTPFKDSASKFLDVLFE